jgi:hypothetical protein
MAGARNLCAHGGLSVPENRPIASMQAQNYRYCREKRHDAYVLYGHGACGVTFGPLGLCSVSAEPDRSDTKRGQDKGDYHEERPNLVRSTLQVPVGQRIDAVCADKHGQPEQTEAHDTAHNRIFL